ncbi:MAG: cytochrome C biogenesis protein [Bacteroidetes bacterium]|nr:MAG: cytochrome C biogenesis protein [Bacteroidota bacterium]
MIESIFNFLSELLYQNFLFAIISSLLWGILSILLSPCHLSSIPLIVGFLSSQGQISTKKSFILALNFAVGILLTIAIIGGITLSLGRLMGDIGALGNYIVAFVFFTFGLYLLDVIRLPWDSASIGKTKFKGNFAAFVLGLIFGIGLGPCTFAFMAPVLGLVFEISQTNLILSIGLLFAFALGHCMVIVMAGTLSKKVSDYLRWTENSNATKYLKRICGALVLLGGFYLIFITI